MLRLLFDIIIKSHGDKGRNGTFTLINLVMPQRILLNSGYSMIVALVWTALFHLNDFFFNAAEVAPLVSLIFLPAVLRPVAVLLFGIPGAVGLMLGSALTIPIIETLNVSLVLTILSNGLVAWVVLAFMRLMPIYRSELTADMSGLTLRTVIVLASLTALVSSLTNSFIFSLSPDLSESSGLILSMLVGDTIGALLMLYLLSIFSQLVSKHFR